MDFELDFSEKKTSGGVFKGSAASTAHRRRARETGPANTKGPIRLIGLI